MNRKKAVGAGFVIGTVLLLLWAFWGEQQMLSVQNETVHLTGWSAETPDMKVIVFGDLHVGSPSWGLARVSAFVEEVNGHDPDLILILGDFIAHVAGGDVVAPGALALQLKQLRAKLGVFAVRGNHDWGAEAPALQAALHAAGIRLLDGKQVQLDWFGTRLEIIGIPDDISRRPTITELVSEWPARPDVPRILITHDPGIFVDLPASRDNALLLAAHTHGGQINLPFIGPPFVPSRAPKSWAHGWSETPAGSLLVTSGLGTSILPVRLGRPPEYVVLRLSPA